MRAPTNRGLGHDQETPMPSTSRATALALLATAALAAASIAAPVSAAAQRGPGVEARTSTVRAVCAGGGGIVVTVDQPPDSPVHAVALVSDVPADSMWKGRVRLISTSGGGGGGQLTIGGTAAEPDGTFTAELASGGPVPHPAVRVNLHTGDD